MLQEITSWCNRNPRIMCCNCIIYFILYWFITGIIKMLRIRGLAPHPVAVNSDYMNPKVVVV